LDAKVTEELYYIIHETVVNSVKSSCANSIKIIVQWGPELVITVKDDGQSRIVAPRGGGSAGLERRAERIGARLKEINTPGGLTFIIAYTPH